MNTMATPPAHTGIRARAGLILALALAASGCHPSRIASHSVQTLPASQPVVYVNARPTLASPGIYALTKTGHTSGNSCSSREDMTPRRGLL